MPPENKIEGGYFLKARKFQKSWISQAPPHIREIWDWLLLNVNYKDNGKIKRGQILTTYAEIQEGLSWFIGYRKQMYKKHHCEIAMKALTRERMIATAKTTRGLLITVLNYDRYQTIENYERHTESHNNATRVLQPTDTILERKEVRKKEKVVKNKFGTFENVFLSEEEKQKLEKKFNGRTEGRINALSEYMKSKGLTYKDHYATILSWSRREEKNTQGEGEWK